MKKRIISMILSIVMVLTMLPTFSLTAFAADGDTTTSEAKWGADADNLTQSGTLEEAIDAAADDSNVKYIQLQSNIENTSYSIYGGEFTIDLNGNDVSSSGEVFNIINSGTKVTFFDSKGGKVSMTYPNTPAVWVRYGASVIINGGEYEGGHAVCVDDGCSAEIIDGTFKSIGYYTV